MRTSLIGTVGLLPTLLGLVGGCANDSPNRPRDIVAGATIDSVWIAEIQGGTVTAGVAGHVPNTCAQFQGASVTYAEPDSYLVTANCRYPASEPCGRMMTPYAGEVSFAVRQGLSVIRVRGRTIYGTWKTWSLALP